MYRIVPPHRVISWPICSVTLTEFVRSHVLVQPAPSHVPGRLFCWENTVNVSQQFSEETEIFGAVFWYVCSWIAEVREQKKSDSQSLPLRRALLHSRSNPSLFCT